MKSLILTLLFIGIIIIIQGYYQQKLKNEKSKKIIKKYIPLNIYEQKMNGSEFIINQFKSSFEKITEI
tara:strand:- start:193 stop:396 length:204 start_codon:yes stop_codon:yes gene_type:complete